MATRKRPDNTGGVPDGLILGVLGFLLVISCLAWTATGISGLLAHGGWPAGVTYARTPAAIRHLATQPHDVIGAWENSSPSTLPGYGLFWGVFISQLMVLFVMTVFLIGVITRYRLVRAARRAAREAEGRVPEPETVDAGHESLPAPRATTNREYDRPSAGTAEDADRRFDPLSDGEVVRSHVAFTPHRSDKGKRLVQPAITNAAGPVIVTTADPANYYRTVGGRAKLGPVLLYDPSRLVDSPDRLRWSPHSGCEKAATAAGRARALLHPLRPHATADAPMFGTAETLLRCWLHAAAVGGLPFRQVARWTNGGTQEAVRILSTSPAAAPGWGAGLESALHRSPEHREAARSLIHRALESLNSVHIRDICHPGRNETFDPESFITERGTLFVVGEPIEDPRTHPGAMPLLTALVSNVVEHGRRMAAESPVGRLDPPLTCVLDDIANLAPLPGLPELLADGTRTGLPTLAILRSQEQARDRWPDFIA